MTAGKIATDAVTSGKISADAVIAGKIAADAVTATTIAAGAITAVKIAAGTITADKITTGTLTATQIASDTITAGNISSLNFTGKTATFDKGTIGGWDISNNAISKSVGGVGRMVLKSSDNTISMFDTSENLRLQLNPSTTLPTLTTPGSSTTINANDGTGATTLAPGTNVTSTIDKTTVAITLSGTNSEIYVDFNDARWMDTSQTPENNAAAYFLNPDLLNVLSAKYSLQVVLTGGAIAGELVQTIGYVATFIDSTPTFSGATLFTSPALFANLPAGNYLLKVRHYVSVFKILGSPGNLDWYRWAEGVGETDGISVLYGTSNAYSVLNAGGMVLSQGSQNYLKISSPSQSADSFFEVRGKSTFQNGLFVSGSISANSKQFQITHPLDNRKWLYHSAIEAPRADLIYRGVLQLQNGSGSVNINSASNMTDGTFEMLTRDRQIFLQNNNGFDRVIGNIENGNLNIVSENIQSENLINWMVFAERNDNEILASKLYDTNGSYKPERYKEYLFIESGSI